LILGNCTVGLYPWGTAAWVRPLFSLFGLAGAIMLLAGIGWWRIILPIWCFLQTWLIATDVSGQWFAQGLFWGVFRSRSVKSGHVLVEYHASGANYAGLILLAVLLVITLFRLHPTIRKPITARQRKIVGVSVLVLVAVIGIWSAVDHARASSARFVLDLDLPAVPIYYQGRLLGRTPLAITPEKIAQWGLPISSTRPLEMFSWGWADSVILSDGVTLLPLYAGPRWPFTPYLDTFETPWGVRCRMHIGTGDNNRLQSGWLWPRAELRKEPILKIVLARPTPVVAGGSFAVNCLLTNPTSQTYQGRKAQLDQHFFSYARRDRVPTTKPAGFRRVVDLPQTWNALAPGARFKTTVDFDAPLSPGKYEYFCTWDLFAPDKQGMDGTLSSGCYSNMLSLTVIPSASK